MPGARDFLENSVDTLTDQAGDLADLVKERAEDALGQIETTVIDNPITTIAGALILGFVLAVLLSRPKLKVVYIRENPKGVP